MFGDKTPKQPRNAHEKAISSWPVSWRGKRAFPEAHNIHSQANLFSKTKQKFSFSLSLIHFRQLYSNLCLFIRYYKKINLARRVDVVNIVVERVIRTSNQKRGIMTTLETRVEEPFRKYYRKLVLSGVLLSRDNVFIMEKLQSHCRS